MTTLNLRPFSTNAINWAKTVPRNLKGKTKSSQEWLMRQFADPYVEKAKMHNYRCRSAFKLIEIDDKYKILKPGYSVVDCGAAPGSWTQVAVQRTNADQKDEKLAKGNVISCDKLQIHPITGAIVLGGTDFTLKANQDKITSLLPGKLDCVLSDMAPNATGIKMIDQESITNLCYTVVRFAVLMSKKDASLLVKIWDNGDVPMLEKDLLRFYESVKRIKPQASRSDSAEMFILARNFKSLDTS